MRWLKRKESKLHPDQDVPQVRYQDVDGLTISDGVRFLYVDAIRREGIPDVINLRIGVRLKASRLVRFWIVRGKPDEIWASFEAVGEAGKRIVRELRTIAKAKAIAVAGLSNGNLHYELELSDDDLDEAEQLALFGIDKAREELLKLGEVIRGY